MRIFFADNNAGRDIVPDLGGTKCAHGSYGRSYFLFNTDIPPFNFMAEDSSD